MPLFREAAFVVLVPLLVNAQQVERPPWNPTDLLVRYLAGAPLSMEVAGFLATNADDGTMKRWEFQGNIYRDVMGRVRSEVMFESPSAFPGTPVTIGVITDPIAGFEYMLDGPSRVADRFTIAKVTGAGGGYGYGSMVGGALLMEKGERTVNDENLGKRMIDGIEFEGTRNTVTMVDPPLRTAISEKWFSEGLQMIGASSGSDPKSKWSVGVQNVVRKEPEPALFALPAGYRIREIVFPARPR